MTVAFVQFSIFMLVLDPRVYQLDNYGLRRSFALHDVRMSRLGCPFYGSERQVGIFCHEVFASVARAFLIVAPFLPHGKHNPRLGARRLGLFVVWTDSTPFGIRTCTTVPSSEQREPRRH